MSKPISIVLLSGGLDSAVALYHAIDHSGADRVHALTFDYGQRHRIEIDRAKAIATAADVEHGVYEVAIPFWTTQPLVDHTQPSKAPSSLAAVLPGRNTILVTLAAMYAQRVGAAIVWLGCCSDDAAVFADCRPSWFLAVEHMMERGVEPVGVRGPLLTRTKAEIVRDAHKRGGRCWDAVGRSWSCYSGSGSANPSLVMIEPHPCGQCGACRARARGFELAGIEDPAR